MPKKGLRAMHLPAADVECEVPDLTDVALTDLWTMDDGFLALAPP
jgi:hypothetical protein